MELTCKVLELMHKLMSKIAKPVKNPQIPCYFPCFQGIRGYRPEDRVERGLAARVVRG